MVLYLLRVPRTCIDRTPSKSVDLNHWSIWPFTREKTLISSDFATFLQHDLNGWISWWSLSSIIQPRRHQAFWLQLMPLRLFIWSVLIKIKHRIFSINSLSFFFRFSIIVVSRCCGPPGASRPLSKKNCTSISDCTLVSSLLFPFCFFSLNIKLPALCLSFFCK